MWEKIKTFFKESVLLIGVPIAFVTGFIYYLLTKNKQLENKIEAKEADKAIDDTLAAKEAAKESAISQEHWYRNLVNQYHKDKPRKK